MSWLVKHKKSGALKICVQVFTIIIGEAQCIDINWYINIQT